MAQEPAKIAIDKISDAASFDGGLRVRLHATRQPGGEPVQIELPYELVPAALQALLAGDDAARAERHKAGIGRTSDAGFAMDVAACHISTTSRPDHVGLGFQMKSGGMLAFAIPREGALQMAELLRKTAGG